MPQVFRLFEPQELVQGQVISIEDDNFRILAKVLRKKIGDTITIMDGRGVLADGLIQSMQSKNAEVLLQSTQEKKRIKPAIELYISALKGDRLSWVLQKATELGVDQIGIFSSDHSIAKKSDSMMKKAVKTLVEAMRQSGNPFLPKVDLYKTIQEMSWSTDTNVCSLVLDETSKIRFHDIELSKDPGAIRLFVGPEGGFSNEERVFFQGKKCKFVKIAPYVLRSETAAISALAVSAAKWKGI